jgi:drug/metabolite transporter (DMT)-like permease
MVLTRNQEAQLKRQYKIDNNGDGTGPTTPFTASKPGGKELRSALKQHQTARPWEERENGIHRTAGGTSKRVRIESENNIVFEFQKSNTSFVDEEGEEGEFSSIKRQLDLDEGSKEIRERKLPGDGVIAFLLLFVWSVSSSCLTVVLKSLLAHERYSLPLLVSGTSQLGCAIMIRILNSLGVIALKPMPHAKEYIRSIAPVALASSLCMYTGNYAYYGLSLSFISILKALTPAVTLLLSVFGGLETFSSVALVSTILIAYGTGIATVDETSRKVDFHWQSLMFFIVSILFESIRIVFVSGSLKAKKYSSFDLLAGAGPLVFSIMGFGSIFLERQKIVALKPSEWLFIAETLLYIVILSFIVNWSTYTALQHTSSTTVKVTGKSCVL